MPARSDLLFLQALALLGLFLTTQSFSQNAEFRQTPIGAEAFNAPQPNQQPYNPEPALFRPAPQAVGGRTELRSPMSSHGSTNNAQPVQQAAFTSTNKPQPQLKPPTDPAKEAQLRKPKSTWSSTLSMFVSLAIVIGLFLLVARMFRGITPGNQRHLPKEVVQVIGRSPLGPRHQMYVVRFGRKLLLVSQQIGQTTTLSEIDEATEVDHLLGLCEQKHADSISNSFKDVLQQMTFGSAKEPASKARPNTSRSTKSQFDTLG